jgi:uncharacterized protein YaiL (DUF2058 family)
MPTLTDTELLGLFRKHLPDTPEPVIQSMLIQLREAEIRLGEPVTKKYAHVMIRNYRITCFRKQQAAVRAAERAQIHRAKEIAEKKRLSYLAKAKAQFEETLEMAVLERFRPTQIDAVFWLGQLVFEDETYENLTRSTGIKAGALYQRCCRIRKKLRPILVPLGYAELVAVLDASCVESGGTNFRLTDSP